MIFAIFFAIVHVGALALLMYLLARHEADISAPKLALVFIIPMIVLDVVSGYIGILALPLYFVVVFVSLKLWFYVDWGKAAVIAGSFAGYMVVFSLVFSGLTSTPDSPVEQARPEFITGRGSFKPFKGSSVTVEKSFDGLSCTIVVDRRPVDLMDLKIPQEDGWFVHCEARDSYWISSGPEVLVHVKADGPDSTIRELRTDPNLLADAPAALAARLEELTEKEDPSAPGPAEDTPEADP